jgi:hypothetical protein
MEIKSDPNSNVLQEGDKTLTLNKNPKELWK